MPENTEEKINKTVNNLARAQLSRSVQDAINIIETLLNIIQTGHAVADKIRKLQENNEAH